MPPTLLAPDTQDLYAPVWVWRCAAFPELCATRDIDVPGVGGPVAGDPFIVGDSLVGGDALVGGGGGGGGGSTLQQAYARIIGNPIITRRLTDTFWGFVEVQDVTVVFANADGALSGDYSGEAGELCRYDVESGAFFTEWTGRIGQGSRGRGTYTVTGTNVDLALLEQVIPQGKITREGYPLAADDAIGATPAWIFGGWTNLPLPCVRDDVVRSEFDYLLSANPIALLDGLRRLTPGGSNPFVDVLFIELEPYPGMAAVLKNRYMEDWPTATTLSAWTLSGAGSLTRNQTPGQFDEGATSASLTNTAGSAVALQQDCHLNSAAAPLSWWRGRTIELRARGRAGTGGRVKLQLDDGIGTSDSAVLHTGSGLFETLAVTRTIAAGATMVRARLMITAGSAITVQFDVVTLFLKPFSWDEVLRPDLYPGMTALRFFFRQDDPSGSLYQIVADIQGLQPERNMVRAARTLLSDPTRGLGQACDAATFDAAELTVARRYEDFVTLGAPQVLITFDRCGSLAQTGGLLPPSFTLPDLSGHDRDATVTNLGACRNDSGIGPSAAFSDFALFFNLDDSVGAIPYSPAFDPGPLGHALEIWYRPTSAVEVTPRPIVEKLVGIVAQSGFALYYQNGLIVYSVAASGGTVFLGNAVSGADTGEDLYLCARAGGGVMTLTIGRAGVLTTTTATYTGTLPSGSGAVRFGKFGTGLAQQGRGVLDNLALYNYALTDAQVQANARGYLIPTDGEGNLPHGLYDVVRDIRLNIDPLPLYYYRLAEASGTTMVDSSGMASPTNGTYVGAINLGEPGPLNPLSIGTGVEDTQISFENNASHYGLVTGKTFSGLKGGVFACYTPDMLTTNGAIVAKTIGGAINSCWLLYQEDERIVWRVKDALSIVSFSYTMTQADVGRRMDLLGTYDTGVLRLYRNGVLVGETTYTSPVAVGVGDCYIGKLDAAGNYPAQGQIGQVVIFDGYAPSGNGELSVQTGQDDAAALSLASTWAPGGLSVDAAFTEPQQAQDWLKQIFQIRGMRLGSTATGALTASVDAAAPATIRLAARDGAGDGERTLLDLSDRQRPRPEDRVRDVVIRYRRNLLKSGNEAYEGERRRPVSTRVDMQGRRIGRDKEILLDVVRNDTTADRIASYLAARYALDETVRVRLPQEARQLVEGDLVQVTDAAMGYAGEILECAEVAKELTEIAAVLREWDETAIYTYQPRALAVPPG